MNADELKNLIEQLGLTPRSYSGRGMFGRECVGFSSESATSDLIDLVDYGMPSGFAKQARTDQLGKREIVYFPSVEWVA